MQPTAHLILTPEHERVLDAYAAGADNRQRELNLKDPKRAPIELKKLAHLERIESYLDTVKKAMAPHVGDIEISLERDEDPFHSTSVHFSIREALPPRQPGVHGAISYYFERLVKSHYVANLSVVSDHLNDRLELRIRPATKDGKRILYSAVKINDGDSESVEGEIVNFLNANIPALDGQAQAQSLIAEHGVVDLDLAPAITPDNE
jgi:hypothetical protein